MFIVAVFLIQQKNNDYQFIDAYKLYYPPFLPYDWHDICPCESLDNLYV